MTDNHGENLRALLRDKRIIQEDFADKMDVSRSYIQRMMNTEVFTAKAINKICSVLDKEYKLNVDKNVYFSLDDNKNVNKKKTIPFDFDLDTFNTPEILKIENQHLREKIEWLEEKADFYKAENERLEEEIKTFREQKTG